jgi:hypothetical protein
METLKIIDELELIYFEPGIIFSDTSVRNYIDKTQEYKIDQSSYQRFFNLSKIKSIKFSYNRK